VRGHESDPGRLAVARTAAGAPDLAALNAAASRCTACPELAAGRTNVVVGVFPPSAELLLVGEAPGAQEDRAGLPFVGKAGQLLDRLLAEAGLRREAVAVTNTVKCRPPGNRVPAPIELARCRAWLDRQVALVDPRLVCTLGGTATRWALSPRVRLNEVRGRPHRALGRIVVPTYHPSAAIRFGPAGAPMAALRADLIGVAALLRRLTTSGA
jgi:uracil-DNA glycosylase